MRVLVSAGEASGDRYAAQLVDALRRRWPGADFYGCTGPRMREAGVRTVVNAASLAVVGLVEVVTHLPRIYGEFRKIASAAAGQRPDFAVLTDSPDFHLRLAAKLKRLGVPVFYLVAPQVWAWRKGRVKTMRRVLDHVFCIFPFEEEFLRSHDVPATYIGHPLAGATRPSLTKEAFFRKHRLPEGRPLVTLLPGSRLGEAGRHLPPLLDAVARLYRDRAVSFVLPASVTTGAAFFRERIAAAPIQVIEGETPDAIAHADAVLAASGTVTIEAALLGTPMVTFYKVAAISWALGRLLVDIPFYCMVNLVAGTNVVPELMQDEMTGERLASETARLLDDAAARTEMRGRLSEVAARLSVSGDPIEHAAALIERWRREFANHVS